MYSDSDRSRTRHRSSARGGRRVSRRADHCPLENIAQSELEDSRRSGARNPTDVCGIQISDRIVQVHPVQHVESFGPKLDTVALPDAEVLDQPEVHDGFAWASEEISAGR